MKVIINRAFINHSKQPWFHLTYALYHIGYNWQKYTFRFKPFFSNLNYSENPAFFVSDTDEFFTYLMQFSSAALLNSYTASLVIELSFLIIYKDKNACKKHTKYLFFNVLNPIIFFKVSWLEIFLTYKVLFRWPAVNITKKITKYWTNGN